MTQSVTQKTSIPEKTWRRQTDSPTWWIAFACGSVILHLLAFWLISLYKFNSLQQRRSQSAVPIEFIEISPQKPSRVQPKPKPKPVLPKPAKPIVPQNSQPNVNPSAVKPPVSTNDRDAIAFNNQKIEQQRQQQLAEQERQQELLQQQQLAEQQRQRETEQLQKEAEELRQRQVQQRQLEAQLQQQEIEQQRQLAQRLRQQEIEQQRQLEAQRQQEAEQQRQLKAQLQQEEQQRQLEAQRQQQAEQQQLETQRQQEAEQQQLAQQSKLEAEEQRQLATEQQPQNTADGEKIANAPTDALGRTPQQREKAPQAPIPQSHQSGGILTASWKIDTDTPFQDKPDNLAKPQKRSNSDIPLPPPQDGNFQPRDFLVWLTIDNQGNLLFVKVDPAIPIALKSQYQEYAEKIFNGQKFIPASSNNGDKPDLSNLPIRVNIQER